jgi:hypothetical protein
MHHVLNVNIDWYAIPHAETWYRDARTVYKCGTKMHEAGSKVSAL